MADVRQRALDSADPSLYLRAPSDVASRPLSEESKVESARQARSVGFDTSSFVTTDPSEVDFLRSVGLPPVSAPVVVMTPELAEGVEMFLSDMEKLDMSEFLGFEPRALISGAAQDGRAVQQTPDAPSPVDLSELQTVLEDAATQPLETTVVRMEQWLGKYANDGGVLFAGSKMPLDSLMAAFMKLGITDPNNSPETQQDLADALMKIVSGFHENEKAANNAAQAELEEAQRAAQRANSCGAATAIALAVAAVVITIATAGVAAPAGAAMMAMAIAAAVIATCVCVGAAVGAAVAAANGGDMKSSVLQGMEYGSMAGCFIAGVAAGPAIAGMQAAKAAGTAMMKEALKRAAQAVAIAAAVAGVATGVGVGVAALVAVGMGLDMKSTLEQAVYWSAMVGMIIGGVAAGVVVSRVSQAAARTAAGAAATGTQEAASEAAKLAARQALMLHMQKFMVFAQAGIASAHAAADGVRAKYEKDAAMEMAEANMKALVSQMLEMLAQAQQEVLSTTTEAIEQIVEAKNGLLAAVATMLKQNNAALIAMIKAPLEARR
jgi:hypothetical protein